MRLFSVRTNWAKSWEIIRLRRTFSLRENRIENPTELLGAQIEQHFWTNFDFWQNFLISSSINSFLWIRIKRQIRWKENHFFSDLFRNESKLLRLTDFYLRPKVFQNLDRVFANRSSPFKQKKNDDEYFQWVTMGFRTEDIWWRIQSSTNQIPSQLIWRTLVVSFVLLLCLFLG